MAIHAIAAPWWKLLEYIQSTCPEKLWKVVRSHSRHALQHTFLFIRRNVYAGKDFHKSTWADSSCLVQVYMYNDTSHILNMIFIGSTNVFFKFIALWLISRRSLWSFLEMIAKKKCLLQWNWQVLINHWQSNRQQITLKYSFYWHNTCNHCVCWRRWKSVVPLYSECKYHFSTVSQCKVNHQMCTNMYIGILTFRIRDHNLGSIIFDLILSSL